MQRHGVTVSVHCLANYVVGPQGLGQEKIAGPAKNLHSLAYTHLQISTFYKTCYVSESTLIPMLNKLHIHTVTHINIVINLLTRGL